MTFWISFPIDTFSTDSALEFLYPFIRVPILSIMSPRSFDAGYTEFRYEDAIERLRQNKDRNFLLSAEKVEPGGTEEVRFNFVKLSAQRTEYFVLSLENETNADVPALLETAASRRMTFAYKFDFQKAFWQSVEAINTYQAMKRPYEHLKRLEQPGALPIDAKVDIRENAGHQRLTYSMKLMAAPEMWFGPGCWAYFDRERVASFPDGEEVRWLGPELLYVRLFDWAVPDYEAGDILRLQERFRQWSEMDAVEERLEGMLRRR